MKQYTTSLTSLLKFSKRNACLNFLKWTSLKSSDNYVAPACEPYPDPYSFSEAL